jgi:hypothetical protein
MNLDLKNKEWKEFVFEQIFDIDSTSSGIDRNKLINKKGVIPYLTRSEKNNGYDSFICEQSDKYKTDDANVITIGLDTQTVFYQPNKFYTGQNIQVLKCEKLNKEIAQFLIPLIKRQMEKFNWGGNGATLTRLRRSKLLLPINEKDEPDFEFMEVFMKQKEQEKFQEYSQYISQHIKELKDFKNVEPIEEKEFMEFEIGKLFNLSQGKSKGLNHLTKVKKGVNYLGATNLNNGVLCQVEKVEKLIHKGNVIAFIRNGEGSMGYSVYKSEEFIATSDISVGYNPNLNRHIGLFITTVADKIRGKYNFGYKRSGNRLLKEKILLPKNERNEPDYDYMENYMKQLEYKKLNEYLTKKQNLNANA